MAQSIPTVLMRGGTSKGLFFLKDDLPADAATRDRVLLAAMGSPDPRQIDGMGGGHPLTSKVAVVSRSTDPAADIDYLFLQVAVDESRVSDSQNCGNMLAGVAQFAIEAGLIKATKETSKVRVRMLNTDGIALVTVCTPDGQVTYAGDAAIDGVPGTAAAVLIDFAAVAGTSCGALLPTGRVINQIDGADVTCIDNGMPVVLLNAADFGKSGAESPETLEADGELKQRLESIRRQAGKAMNLGDVTHKTVPKMSLLSAPLGRGHIATRTFIPHRVHQAIGVLGAASVAAGCLIPGSVAQRLVDNPPVGHVLVEHPTGSFAVDIELEQRGETFEVTRSALLRTARKLMAGEVFLPAMADAS